MSETRKYRYHSPIVSAEWSGFTKAPWGASLINFEPQDEPIVLETYRTWAKLFELYKYYSWIIDRFHISTQASRLFYADKRYDFAWLEKRLVKLGFRLVFCYRRPESFEEARDRRLKISSNPSQYEDFTIFIREQEVVQEFVDASLLPNWWSTSQTTGWTGSSPRLPIGWKPPAAYGSRLVTCPIVNGRFHYRGATSSIAFSSRKTRALQRGNHHANREPTTTMIVIRPKTPSDRRRNYSRPSKD